MKKKLVLAAGALVLAAAGLSTLAWARSGADAQEIHACVSIAGVLRVPAAGAACRNNETPLVWNTVGPQGPQGPAGPQGPQGPAGASGGGSGGSGGSTDAVDGSMSVTGQRQGQFSTAPIEIIGFSHEVISPRDAASGLPTGKRQHKPLVITKELDKTSPLLMAALFTNETLDVSIDLTVPGKGAHAVTVHLTNASLASRSQEGTSETVSFTYKKITWTWNDGGIVAEDDWETPVS